MSSFSLSTIRDNTTKQPFLVYVQNRIKQKEMGCLMKDLTCIVVGGGFAGIHALKAIHKACHKGIGGRKRA